MKSNDSDGIGVLTKETHVEIISRRWHWYIYQTIDKLEYRLYLIVLRKIKQPEGAPLRRLFALSLGVVATIYIDMRETTEHYMNKNSHNAAVQLQYQHVIGAYVFLLDCRQKVHVRIINSFEFASIELLVIDFGSGLPRV